MPSKPRSRNRRLATLITVWRFSAAWVRLTRILGLLFRFRSQSICQIEAERNLSRGRSCRVSRRSRKWRVLAWITFSSILLFRFRSHSISIIEFDHNLKEMGVGHEKEETCSLSRCPDRGVRGGRIRYSCPSRSKSLCPERPEAGTTDRQTGDGSASDRIRTRLHGRRRGEGGKQSRFSRRRQDRGTACECRSAGQGRSAADADRRNRPPPCAYGEAQRRYRSACICRSDGCG